MNPVHEDICSNYATKGKVMTEKQLMTLLSLVAEYDFKLPDMTGWSVRKASQVIDLTLSVSDIADRGRAAYAIATRGISTRISDSDFIRRR